MVKKVLLGLVVVLLFFMIVVATQPAAFRIERQTTVNAPADIVFAMVNDFHQWNTWSPWEKMDPAMKKTFEGPLAGVGSIYSWVGNDEVGEGRMTILESAAAAHLTIKLEFMRPWTATNVAEFVFAPAAEGATDVTWAMSGENGFMGKMFGLLMDMDAMVGKDFEKGLASLKTLAEAEAKKRADAAAAAAAAEEAAKAAVPPAEAPQP